MLWISLAECTAPLQSLEEEFLPLLTFLLQEKHYAVQSLVINSTNKLQAPRNETKNTPEWQLWLQEYPSDILYPLPSTCAHDLVASLWGLTKWQTERRAKLAAGDIRNPLCLSQVTQTVNRLGLTTVTFQYIWNKSSACHLILLFNSLPLNKQRNAWLYILKYNPGEVANLSINSSNKT